MRKIQVIVASTFVSVAGLVTCVLPVALIALGISHRVEVPSSLYIGAIGACLLFLTGYAIASRPWQGLPGALTVLLLGAIAQPLTSSLSNALRRDDWGLGMLLALAPVGIAIAGLRIGNAYFAEKHRDAV
jgi:hypothetical protein